MTDPDKKVIAWEKEDAGKANLGAKLREAREHRNLSVVSLARCLRLSPRVIDCLEANQVDQLPAPAYVKGYLHSIAKEIEIDSASLIAIYELQFRSEPPSLAEFGSRAPAQLTSDSNIIRRTTIALCIVMVLMVALWWRAHDIELPSFVSGAGTTPTSDEVFVPATDPLPYSFELIVHPDTPFYRASITAAANTGDTTDAVDAVSNAVTPESDAELSISTVEEVWVEVSDARGNRLYYDLAKPGSDIRITGERPYSLVIGNSAVVTVTLDGERIDITPYSKFGVARLRLGDSAE